MDTAGLNLKNNNDWGYFLIVEGVMPYNSTEG